MTTRVLIVDDEPLARRGVRLRLKAFPNLIVVGEYEDGPAAVRAIQKLSPELVFLDVQMPGMNGFEVLQHLVPGYMPLIIFLTAYDQYALRAFEVHALDYLLKPIDEDRFTEAVERACRQIELQNAGVFGDRLHALLAEYTCAGRNTTYADRFAVRTGTRIAFVLAEEIDWIEATGDYVGLHVRKTTHLLRETLNNLEAKLNPSRFIRIHRSTIVQVARIQELHSLPNREFRVRLIDGTELKASRTYCDRLAKWLP